MTTEQELAALIDEGPRGKMTAHIGMDLIIMIEAKRWKEALWIINYMFSWEESKRGADFWHKIFSDMRFAARADHLTDEKKKYIINAIGEEMGPLGK